MPNNGNAWSLIHEAYGLDRKANINARMINKQNVKNFIKEKYRVL